MNKTENLRQRMAEVIEQYLNLDTALREAEGVHFRVCIFGSARIQPNDAIYNSVYDVSRKLALLGIDIVTGGGPGLMEAANRAVRDAHVKRVKSYGLPLDIPGIKEAPNPHLDIKSMHRRFSSRLDEFMRLSDGIIVAPGGIGTLLELFYVWQLLQLAMVEPRPVVLLGRDFWAGLIKWMNETVLEHRLISPGDVDRITLVDTADEAIAVIQPAFEAFRAKRREARAAERAAREENKKQGMKEIQPLTSALSMEPTSGEPNGNGPSPSLAPKTAPDPLAVPVTPVDRATDLLLKGSRRREHNRRRVADKYARRTKNPRKAE
jgi:uncharacterized protein (TIGR00730 family)